MDKTIDEQIAELEAQMNEVSFWNDKDHAQEVIKTIKQLNKNKTIKQSNKFF
jgi:hypothetical protein